MASLIRMPQKGLSEDSAILSKWYVKEGDTVKKGQTVIILEAMKMENNINAHKDGKISEIKVKQGDSVLEGTDLVIIE